SATWRWCCRPACARRRWRRCSAACAGRCSSGSRCSTSIAGPGCPRGTAASPGTRAFAIPAGRCASARWTRCSPAGCGRWRRSLAYDGERPEARVLDQLETILRHVADELAGWRARALKAEAELKEGAGGRGAAPAAAARPDPELRTRVADLEQENKTLRQRVEAARARVHDLLARLTFLEEQARQGGGGGRREPWRRRRGGRGRMSVKKHAVKVMIGGEEYTVRSDLPPEYTREVAAYVDQALKKVLAQGPIVEIHKAAILAALDITNELFQARKGEREVAARLAALADDLTKLLPPGKRRALVGQA